mmetsp:Transcript_33160/g.38613  ORF Transcript_33160/g.38613 Transcript_33160/m.38613 type:complete len:601 (+) Transcript_33160:229-2031(+)
MSLFSQRFILLRTAMQLGFLFNFLSLLPFAKSFIFSVSNKGTLQDLTPRQRLIIAQSRSNAKHNEYELHQVNNDEYEKLSHFEDRRHFLSAMVGMSSLPLFLPTDEANAAFPFFDQQRSASLSVISNKENSTSATAIRRPPQDLNTRDPELIIEICMLELLPEKNAVFRALEKYILKVSSLRDNDESPSKETFEELSKIMRTTLNYLDDQRLKLAPVFNQEDSTLLSIEKATRGETLIENLRDAISNLIHQTKIGNLDGTLMGQKIALRSLAEVGELLVESFPYAVPTVGKFSFLPRLLGRAQVTFTITRPPSKSERGSKEQVLGNVTILADGFAAPITAGNFVDLSSRNFYTGLPVKEMKKRLGARPTLTLPENNVVTYDIASTVEKLTGEGSVVQKAIDNVIKLTEKTSNSEEEDDSTKAAPDTISTTMPIMGSFNEGFYDPLTAKPRRIPLEVVQYDNLIGRARLSYESSFTSNISASSKLSKLKASLSPVSGSIQTLLTFDIPGLVAMNHPDKNLDGGSSEFFCLTEKDLTPDRAALLNGKYAPFGYVLDGLDILNNLQTDDIISATFVDEWGKLNLKRIKGTSFTDAISQSDDDE